MSDADRAKLAEYRALRDTAWAVVRDDLDELQGDLAAHGIGARIKDRAAEEAQEAWDQARDIAGEHKGVVAGTFLALVAWLLRGPIGDALSALLGRDGDKDEEPPGGENVEGA